jgi:HD-GYP domain-containing protein (c-di-GMP phosphodiesterase class II)
VLAALYHDVGKLTLAGKHSKKTGKLSKAQKEVVRKAEQDGVNLIDRKNNLFKVCNSLDSEEV